MSPILQPDEISAAREALRTDVARRFLTKVPTEEQFHAMERNRQTFLNDSLMLIETTPMSRELSLALTHLEEAKFWANQAIMQHGVLE